MCPRRRPGTGDLEMSSPSVTFRFRTITRRYITIFFSKLYWYVHHAMGVCCIVFDFDRILLEIL